MGQLIANSWTTRRGPTNFPAPSSDLTPFDVFSWGFVDGKVYKTKFTSLALVKRRITSTIQKIPTDILQDVLQDIPSYFSTVLRGDEGHVQYRQQNKNFEGQQGFYKE